MYVNVHDYGIEKSAWIKNQALSPLGERVSDNLLDVWAFPCL